MNWTRSGAVLCILLLMPTLALAQGAAVRLQDGTGNAMASVSTAGGVKSEISATRQDAATSAGYSRTTGATITLTPTSGQFVYITGIDISNCAGAAAVVPAAPTYITTTNLTGAPQYQAGTGLATTGAGTCQPPIAVSFSSPLKATVITTSVTFVLPTFATNQTISVNVYWYSGN